MSPEQSHIPTSPVGVSEQALRVLATLPLFLVLSKDVRIRDREKERLEQFAAHELRLNGQELDIFRNWLSNPPSVSEVERGLSNLSTAPTDSISPEERQRLVQLVVDQCEEQLHIRERVRKDDRAARKGRNTLRRLETSMGLKHRSKREGQSSSRLDFPPDF